MTMHVYQMTVEQLHVAHAKVCKLAVEIGPENPEAAWLMMDACKLALDEIMVHVCRGDRELAAEISTKMSPHLGEH